MPLLTDVLGLEQIAALCLHFVVTKVSGIDSFNLPHILLNNLIFLFPTKESLNALNGPRQHKRSKEKQNVKKHRTVADRINALQFESEKIQQAMCINFAGETQDSLRSVPLINCTQLALKLTLPPSSSQATTYSIK
jgi:hypothetical protein